MDGGVEQFGVVLLVAATVATIARRLKLPYTVGLVLGGLALGFAPIAKDWGLTRTLLFSTLLPPLVYEAGLNIKWPELKRSLFPVLVLATLGLGLSALVVGSGMSLIAGWPIGVAALFGILISATDPVSVVAMMKDTKVGGRLRLLMEAESLFNDGTAAVGFTIMVALIGGTQFNGFSTALEFIRIAGGGVLCGGLVAGVCLFLAGRTDDDLVTTAFSVVSAYSSFLIAEEFHFSGVLAAVVAGLVFGNLGHMAVNDEDGHEALVGFWEFGAFVANSFVFLLMGVRLSQTKFAGPVMPVVLAIVLALVGRAAAVYVCGAAFSKSVHKIPLGQMHVLTWGGLRGALSLALVLGLPDTFPDVEALRLTTFCVVVFSVLVQGITVGPLLRRIAGSSPPVAPEPG